LEAILDFGKAEGGLSGTFSMLFYSYSWSYPEKSGFLREASTWLFAFSGGKRHVLGHVMQWETDDQVNFNPMAHSVIGVESRNVTSLPRLLNVRSRGK